MGESQQSPEITKSKTYQVAIKLLSQRAYSSVKLKQKLIDKTMPESDVEAVIELLHSWKYLRDDLYLESRIKKWAQKGLAPGAIGNKVKQEGLKTNLEFIELTLDKWAIDCDSILDQLVEKKMRPIENFLEKTYDEKEKIKNKVFRFLLSKGHPFNEIQDSWKKYLYALKSEQDFID